MNREDVIRWAREARLAEPSHPMNPWGASDEALERFAALVAAAEREDAVRCLVFHGCDDAILYLEWRWKYRAQEGEK